MDPARQQQAAARNEYLRYALLTMLFFMIFTNDNGGPNAKFSSVRESANKRAARARHSLDVLNYTRWQDFSPRGYKTPAYEPGRYLNLTGFREKDEYAWEMLDGFRERSELCSKEAMSQSSGKLGEIYQNATGVVVGEWTRNMVEDGLQRSQKQRNMNLTEILPDVEWTSTSMVTRNITGSEGKLMLRVDEKNVEELDYGKLNLLGIVQGNSDPGLVREVSASLTIHDETSSGDGWEMKLHGVHWPKTGAMLMTTTSEKFAGIFGLPHLTLNSQYFASSQKLLNMTLEKTVKLMEKAGSTSPPWASSLEGQTDVMISVLHCEFVAYLQIYPVSSDLSAKAGYLQHDNIVHDIEQELRYPNGAPLPPTPRLQMSSVIFSPDCGFILESKGPPNFPSRDGEHLLGKKQEILLSDITHSLLMFSLVMFGQIMLMKIQSKEASTPSTTGRVSIYTLAMMLMGDSFTLACFIFLIASAPILFPSSTIAAFIAFMTVGLGGKFVAAVYNVQEPERIERLRLQMAAEAAAAPPLRPPVTPGQAAMAREAIARAIGDNAITAVTTTVNTLPPPRLPTSALAAPVNIPIIIPSDQDIDAEIAENTTTTTVNLLPTTNAPATIQPQLPITSTFAAVYTKFCSLLGLILLFSASASSWSDPYRTAYANLFAFIYLSFWIPQIRRNILRNCRKALLWKFVVGQSVLRLLPVAYFYLKEDNVFFAGTDWKAFCVLAGWVWLQVWVLVAQEILGPRWGVPKGWTEEGWDYHPILREDNVEAGGLPIGLVQTSTSPTLERVSTSSSEDQGPRKKNDGTFRSVDCAICMQVLEAPIVTTSNEEGATASGGFAGLLARRLYMVTPCRHVFHSACLEGWMRFRLQCPICRENLPPL